ncbi:MAG: hypothetical protein KDN19_21985 [Verrucomicrobiae bacterium]|nr:hypothetical protein [Verrucomicrobiae bacterium]
MTLVTQYNEFACFAACLESIKRDWGDCCFRHKKFVESNLEIFNGGNKHEGLAQDPIEACRRAGLDAEWFSGSISYNPDQTAVLLYIWIGNQESEKHVVRLLRPFPDKLKVMNPVESNCYDCISPEWVKAMLKVTRP